MGITVGTGELLQGINKYPLVYGTDFPEKKGDYGYYWSGTPAGAAGAGTAGFCNVTSETALYTFDIGGFRKFAITLHNRDDEDIDGGGANIQDLNLYVDGSLDPDFAAGVVAIINGTAVGEGVETTWHFGEGIRGWVDTEATPINYDFDGTSLVTIANEGHPFRYLKIGMKAESTAHCYFELWFYAV